MIKEYISKKINIIVIFLGIGVVLLSVMLVQKIPVSDWVRVGSGIDYTISGIALVKQTKDGLLFLVVHDNKGNGNKNRFGLILFENDKNIKYIPLRFANSDIVPNDLEAVSIVPIQNDSFMALSSSGQVYHVKLDTTNNKLYLLKVFNLPLVRKNSNFEGLAIQKIDDKMLIVWANRGSDTEPGIIYWGLLNLDNYQITKQNFIDLKVPFPLQNVRHISDMKLDSAGSVYITATMDYGNDGPFKSAVYISGVFCLSNNEISFRINSDLVPLYRLDNHKVEGIELVSGASGGVFLGTDDENNGSFIRRQ